MEHIDKIKEAIERRKSIRFIYNKPNKPRGVRFGNPHALYIENNTGNVLLDLYQTEGYSDSVESGKSRLPFWNRFNIEFIDSMEIIQSNLEFEIAEGYNPYSNRYYNSITIIE